MIVIQYIRSIIFNVQMYVVLAIIAICGLPIGILGGRKGATWVAQRFCLWVRFSARWIIGLRTEVRGEIPTDNVLIAAKHQSFLDILMIYSAVPAGLFIMKKELVWTPFVGWYGYLIGCIPVDRSAKGAAVKKMLSDVKSGKRTGGQLIIFSQGTRVAPGVKAKYKIGTGALYNQLGQPCVPVAVNVGVFWPRQALLRKPGLAVIEFLPRIEANLPVSEFMDKISTVIETNSDRLMREAGFDPDQEA